MAEAFVPSTSVSSIEDWNRNAYYKSEEEYLFALAEAMGEEYRAIVDAGFVLQVDDPHLVTYYVCASRQEHGTVPQVDRAAGRSDQSRAARNSEG